MTCPNCGSTAWTLVDDNGVVDPSDGDRIEWCECECGNQFTLTLTA
jgi:hypothetical protein